jgi:small-conductance mechanosensitive channel
MDDLQQALNAIFALGRDLVAELTSIWLVVQVGLLGISALVAMGLAVLVHRKVDIVSLTMGWPAYLRLLVRVLSDNLATIIFVILVAGERAGMMSMTWPSRSYLLGVASALASAWVIVILFTSTIRNKFVNRLVAISAWTIAALSIVGLLGPVTTALDTPGILVGGARFTPLLLLKATVLLLLSFWVAGSASNFFDRRLATFSDLTPSIQVLLGKLIRIGLMALGVVLALSSVGIDLSALALFSGAVGVGVGFGLQKIVSNLVSGIILLADKSIKPGDVISVGEHFGWVGTMGARYTSVDTRDGREYLIPNEDFVTQRVVNWSYSSDLMRLDVKFTATYGSDPHKVREIAVAAAASVERVLPAPRPNCLVTAFASNGIDYILQFWIHASRSVIPEIRSNVLLTLWDTFAKEGVDLPKPAAAQRIILERDHPASPSRPARDEDTPAATPEQPT